MKERRSHFDVTNRVHIADPGAVCEAVCAILKRRYAKVDLRPVRLAFDTFGRMYAGTLPGYHGCDTWYHDAQHSLDCALAMARLVDGHDRVAAAAQRLGPRRARLGVICALFHDAGYIRRYDDDATNGAEFTLSHVGRSAEFLREFLPRIGFGREARLAARIVHFTGYEIALDRIRVRNRRDRALGFLLGTADVLAQMSDRCYLEKCRTFLYHEFETCGLAGQRRPDGPRPIYESPEDLMVKTPEFAKKLFAERLDGYFLGMHRYMREHFNGINPYLFEIEKQLEHVQRVIAQGGEGWLRRRPQSVNARALRRILKLRLADFHPRMKARVAARKAREESVAERGRKMEQYRPY
ncbi:MAG TPA: HD domain-containing protein [Candidatus Binatia bacterium]|nr:HD domain-containing protein [Candidatus Binatia bacterium]